MTIVCLEEHMATPGLQNLEPDEAVAVQSQANDIIAAAVQRHPDRPCQAGLRPGLLLTAPAQPKAPDSFARGRIGGDLAV